MYKVDTYFNESIDKYTKEEYTNTVVIIEYRGVEQLAARRAHNPKVVGSSPTSATKIKYGPLVKRLRHHPFTVVTGVRFSYGSPIKYAGVAQW